MQKFASHAGSCKQYNVSHYEYLITRNVVVQFLGEDQEMKSSSKTTLMTSSHAKKNKVSWTKDLHNKFLKAIEKLGVDSKILNESHIDMIWLCYFEIHSVFYYQELHFF